MTCIAAADACVLLQPIDPAFPRSVEQRYFRSSYHRPEWRPPLRARRARHTEEQNMQSRPSGRSDRNVGEIGFGARAIGAAGGKGDGSEFVAAMHAALDAGLDFNG